MRSSTLHAAGLPNSYSAQKWISARFLSLIENTGMRKFIVHPTPAPTPTPTTPPPHDPSDDDAKQEQDARETPAFFLWLFTPDLLFSSSIPSPSRHDPTRAMKIFYKHQAYTPLRPGDPEPAHIEDVAFPPDLYEELDSALQLSQRVLPATARKWGEWNVGLLERFDGGEVLGGNKGGLGGLESEDVD